MSPLVGFSDVLEALSPLLARLTPVQKALLDERTGQKLQAVADEGHQQAYNAFFTEADTNEGIPSSSGTYPLAQQLTEALAAAEEKNFAPLEACVPCLERLSVLELRQCPVNLVSSLASLSYYSKIHAPLNALARVCGLMQVDVLLDLHAHTFLNVIACAEQGQTRVFDAMAPLLRHVPVTMYTRLDPKMFSNVVAYQKKVYEETQKNNTLFPVKEWQFLTKPAVLHAHPTVLRKVLWFARTTGLISPEIVTKTVLFELSLQEFLQLSPCTLQELLRLKDVHVRKQLAHLLSAMTVEELRCLAPETRDAILEGCRDSLVLFDALCPKFLQLSPCILQELLRSKDVHVTNCILQGVLRLKDVHVTKQLAHLLSAMTVEEFCCLEPETHDAILEGCRDSSVLFDALCPIIQRLTKEQLDSLVSSTQKLLANLAVEKPTMDLSPNSWVGVVQGVWTGVSTWVSENLLRMLEELVSRASVTVGRPSNRPAQKPQLDLGSSSPQVSYRSGPSRQWISDSVSYQSGPSRQWISDSVSNLSGPSLQSSTCAYRSQVKSPVETPKLEPTVYFGPSL